MTSYFYFVPDTKHVGVNSEYFIRVALINSHLAFHVIWGWKKIFIYFSMSSLIIFVQRAIVIDRNLSETSLALFTVVAILFAV